MTQPRLPVVARQSKLVDAAGEQQISDALAMLRTCVHDRGWTLEALAAEMRVDKSLIGRVLNGERPLTLAFLLALPDDVEALYEQRRAEALGLIVIAPVCGEQAVRNLVSGLLGVLSPRILKPAIAIDDEREEAAS